MSSSRNQVIQRLRDLAQVVVETRKAMMEGRLRFDISPEEVTGEYDWMQSQFLGAFAPQLHSQSMGFDFQIRELLAQSRAAESSIQKKKEFSDAVTAIMDFYSYWEAEYLLSWFVSRLYRRATGRISEEEIESEVSFLINDIERKASKYHVESWLEGIMVGNKRFELSNMMCLRPPTNKEISQMKSSVTMFPDIDSSIAIQGSVLEFDYIADTISELGRSIDNTVTMLQLYSSCSVRQVWAVYSPDSYTRQQDTESWQPSSHVFKTARFPDGTQTQFQEFSTALLPNLIELKEHNANPDRIALLVALQRFKDAILNTGPYEQAVTFGIVTLESLLLRPRERTRLSHRLAERLAIMLDCFDFNSADVQQKAKKAYNIRSNFVHGGRSDTKEFDDVTEICDHVLKYARTSVQIFLQTMDIGKHGFIELLDNAISDPERCNELKRVLSSVLVH